MNKGRVIVAMSGGVDSAVSAALLHSQGYEVIGITMRLWTLERDDLPSPHRTCCSIESVEDAQRVCEILGVPHYFMNFERPFKTHVVDYFVSEYALGRTPNPCLACNQYVKFDVLMAKAAALGADYLATGHYARIGRADGHHQLLRAVDSAKDQSYVLYTLGQEELSRLLLPVGEFSKTEIREIATEFDLPVADKLDSQDICFIPDRDYRSFVAERVDSPPGPIVDSSGVVRGAHRGIAFYTIGQRQGLGIASSQRMYVVDIDPQTNTVVVGSQEELGCSELLAEDVSFVSGGAPEFPANVTAKIRYNAPEAQAVIFSTGRGIGVRFSEPQRAIAPGQSVVFYCGDEVLGGGIIKRLRISGDAMV